MRWDDIPKLPTAHYSVTISLGDLEHHLEHIQKMETDLLDFRVDLDPEFQRGHVWTEDQQIAFMEWFLRGGESGRTIICNCPGWMHSFRGPYQLVDGKQRLRAALRFLHSEIPVFGHYCNEFEGRVPLDVSFLWVVGSLKTQAEVLEWYLAFNSGGTMHTPEEIARVRKMLEEAHPF